MRQVNISGVLSNTALRANEYFRRTWNLKEVSYEDLDTVFFRKARLKSCIQQLLDAVNGRQIEIRTLVTDSRGDFVKENVDSLVRDLMQCLAFYMKYKQSEDNSQSSVTVHYPNGLDTLNSKRVSLFYSFLYLAVIHLMYTDACLSDVADLAAKIPVYGSYRECLASQFEQLYIPASLPEAIRDLPGNAGETDMFELNARSLPHKRSCWLETMRDTQTKYYGLSGKPHFDNVITRYRYLTHASEEDISQMLKDLEERNASVPSGWIEEYAEISETYKDIDLYRSDSTLGWEKDLLERSINEFLHLQHHAISSEVFMDAVSGMIDVYTVRGGSALLSRSDPFYKVFDELKKTERYALDQMLPFKREAK